jgi:broad specificity phosphatase PhoE
VTLLLVRHADAGDRAAWTGDDARRPLSASGRAQAEALVEVLADRAVTRVLSSPAVRCTATAEPIAAARGLDVEAEEALAEGAPFDVVDRLLHRHRGDDVLLCSHGDVIGALITSVRRRGIHLTDPPRWAKGSTWVLDDWPEPRLVELVPPPGPS